MRLGVTLKIGGTFQAEQQPPHYHHQMAPPTAGWKSPVPYLFGGLAAMLGLIAFALLILACSYWKLSGYNEENVEGEDSRSDGKLKEEITDKKVMQRSILVIMAGEEKPTFLATPAASSGGCDGGGGGEKEEKVVVVATNGGDEEKR